MSPYFHVHRAYIAIASPLRNIILNFKFKFLVGDRFDLFSSLGGDHVIEHNKPTIWLFCLSPNLLVTEEKASISFPVDSVSAGWSRGMK